MRQFLLVAKAEYFRFVRVAAYSSISVCLFTTAHGQSLIGNSRTEFRGRLSAGDVTTSYSGLQVEVTNLDNNTFRERADVASDGSFAFRELPMGDYHVRVLTLYGDEITSEIVSLGPVGAVCEIKVPQAKIQKPISGTVSLQELTHPPSKQVRKLLESGGRLFQSEHYGEAVARFREATRDDPDCPQAHAELGLALTKTGAWSDAVAEYRAAIALDPRNSVLHTNLGGSLAVLKHFDEAETEALTALKLDKGNARAHLIMAAIMLQKPERAAEAMPHLLAAEETFPSAKSAVEKICAANRVPGCP